MSSDQGANIKTTSAGGKLVFESFAALAEFERELIRKRTKAGLDARARDRKGEQKFSITRAQAATGERETSVADYAMNCASDTLPYIATLGQTVNSGNMVIMSST